MTIFNIELIVYSLFFYARSQKNVKLLMLQINHELKIYDLKSLYLNFQLYLTIFLIEKLFNYSTAFPLPEYSKYDTSWQDIKIYFLLYTV